MRIPFPDPAVLSETQLKYWNGTLNVGKMCAHLPDDVLTGLGAFGGAILNNSTLDPILREMAIVRVGYLSEAPYEIHQHVQYSRKVGMPESKLAALWSGSQSPVFTPKESAVLAFTEELVAIARPSDSALHKLQQHLSVPEILTLVLTIGLYMTISRVLETAGVELDADGVVVDPRASLADRGSSAS